MQIQFGSTVLVPGGSQGVVGAKLNGRQVSDAATFFRAIAGTFFSRGNKTTDFQFDAWWYFNTIGDAENFILSHWASLAASDLLTVTCGDGEAVQYVYQIPLAVLESVTLAEWKGTSVRMHYTFQGGLFATQSIQPPNEDNLIKRGTVALNSGDTSKVVTFASAFAAVPVIYCKVMRASTAGDTVVDWDAPSGNAGAGGFTAAGQAIPGPGYTLNWIAISP